MRIVIYNNCSSRMQHRQVGHVDPEGDSEFNADDVSIMDRSVDTNMFDVLIT